MIDKIILSIDPGGTSGLALQLAQYKFVTSVAHEPESVWDFIKPNQVDIVLYEQFGAQLISKYGLLTVRIIGGIQALCKRFEIPCYGRPPQVRKAMLMDARKYLAETKGETFVVHEVDALAHLMVFIKTNKGLL